MLLLLWPMLDLETKRPLMMESINLPVEYAVFCTSSHFKARHWVLELKRSLACSMFNVPPPSTIWIALQPSLTRNFIVYQKQLINRSIDTVSCLHSGYCCHILNGGMDGIGAVQHFSPLEGGPMQLWGGMPKHG